MHRRVRARMRAGSGPEVGDQQSPQRPLGVPRVEPVVPHAAETAGVALCLARRERARLHRADAFDSRA